MTSLDLAQQRLRAFAAEAAATSPLYEHLASRAAADPEVADLLTAASEDSPPASSCWRRRIGWCRPSRSTSCRTTTRRWAGRTAPDESTWPLFRDFAAGARPTGCGRSSSTQVIQTNEVRPRRPALPGRRGRGEAGGRADRARGGRDDRRPAARARPVLVPLPDRGGRPARRRADQGRARAALRAGARAGRGAAEAAQDGQGGREGRDRGGARRPDRRGRLRVAGGLCVGRPTGAAAAVRGRLRRPAQEPAARW